LGFRNFAFLVVTKKRFFWFPKYNKTVLHENAIFSNFEITLFPVAKKKLFFRSLKNRFPGRYEKAIFFGLRKIAFSSSGEKGIFSGRHEKNDFFVLWNTLFQVVTKKRFFCYPKNDFFGLRIIHFSSP
jgi:hypothetical protein